MEEDNIDTLEIRNALDEARKSLRQTIAEVSHSAELVSEYVVGSCLPIGMCIVAGLGFVAANRGVSTGIRGGIARTSTLVLGGLLGALLTEASRYGRNHATSVK